ncbi:MAG: cell division protein FtsZ [Prevotellaceae bacterium]|jgi:cell division protein FtsZ|nr:cell division protein FtsZ [Prevotellaceae bacterium]
MEEVMDLLEFNAPAEESSIIKVIGVGGGGSNAVNHMFRGGIKDVSFIVCNTDNQALNQSPVEHKIQLGPETTGGLGAGNKPEVARRAAEESIEEIRSVLTNNTKMVFITAGMGGGTGTGAAPVIAKVAKELAILTVGIITIPFTFEGKRKIAQALEGLKNMKDNVDALLVINNERLIDIYGEMEYDEAFAKADDVLKDAAKGIAEIITMHGHMNVDFADVDTILRGGGVAIMNTGYASGENRLLGAIDNALKSPLLRNRDIKGAQKVMMVFYCRKDNKPIKTSEIRQINEFMESIGDDVEEMIWGIGNDNSLEEEVKVTLLATGFGEFDVSGDNDSIDLEIEIPVADNVVEKITGTETDTTPETVTNFPADNEYNEYYGDTKIEQQKRTENFASMMSQTDDEKVVEELENQPAYKRRSSEAPQPYRPRNTNA